MSALAEILTPYAKEILAALTLAAVGWIRDHTQHRAAAEAVAMVETNVESDRAKGIEVLPGGAKKQVAVYHAKAIAPIWARTTSSVMGKIVQAEHDKAKKKRESLVPEAPK